MEPPDNQPLLFALRALFDAPEYARDLSVRPVLEAFVQSTLLSGEDEEGAFTVDLDDGVYLALFTDPMELHMFEPGSRWTAMPAEDAIRSVARGDFEGLIINPAGQSFELSREDVEDFFELD
jgi:hypothetical protein